MTTHVDSWGHGYQPDESVWRSADLTVILLVLVALIGGVFLRQNALALETVTSEGISFGVPRGTIARTEEGAVVGTTREGFTIRMVTLDVPPIGGEDVAALATTRALQLTQTRQMFQSVETDQVNVGDKTAGVMEYHYVQSTPAQAFSSPLQVIIGRELLVVNGDRLYAISLEGPSEKRSELNALWSQLQSSVRFGG